MTIAPLDHATHHTQGGAAHRVTESFIRAAESMGYPHNDDFGASTEGVGCNEVNAKGGRRCNTSAYLKA